MHVIPFILADHDDNRVLIKLVIFGIFAILWAIKSIADLAGAKPKGPSPTVAPPLPPALPSALPRRPIPAPPLPGRTPQRNPIPPRRVAAPARAQSLPPLHTLTRKPAVPRKPQAVPVVSVTPPPQRKPAPASPATATLRRSTIAPWVSAQTLRSQFILAEALRPPVALRKKPQLS